jgi:hypothetical protein
MAKLLALGSEEELQAALKEAYGIKPEMPQYAEILRIWRKL